METASPFRYEAIVLGTGQGGKPLAVALAEAGWRTAIVERGPVGGTCVNVGCTPTKTVIASARIAHLSRRAAEYGLRGGAVGVDLAAVKRRKDSIVEQFRGGNEKRLTGTKGLDLVLGVARFSGPRTVEVTAADGSKRSLASERIFVNVGCRPAVPRVAGLQDVDPLDSSSILDLEEIPEKLVVLGGGYVGVEFGQAFRRFGSEVAIVQRGPALLAREDPEVASAVATILAEDGIELLFESEAVRARRREDGRVELTIRSGGGERTIACSRVLAAAGRVPNTDTLDLAAAGVRTDDRGFVVVNERLETSAPGIWCLGDANGGPAFTHVSYDDYRIVRTNLLEGGAATTRGRLVPYTVYLDPQLGRVGLTEAEARAAGREVRIATLPMSSVARAIETGETRGFLRAVVDAGTDHILGFAALGIEGGELMSMLQIAMMGKLKARDLHDAVFAHPTLAECFNNLFATPGA
jgi:pyruvate/2-oxoglutarate dehydrogenase complex dihydrolipoamide dehydrogenase (E3) component